MKSREFYIGISKNQELSAFHGLTQIEGAELVKVREIKSLNWEIIWNEFVLWDIGHFGEDSLLPIEKNKIQKIIERYLNGEK